MDRRNYSRLKKNIPCSIYCADKGSAIDEINAKVIDMSEEGISFEIEYSEELGDTLYLGMPLRFQFVDDYIYIDGVHKVILQESLNIRNIKVGKRKIRIGGKIKKAGENWVKYITRQKVMNFVNNNFQIN